MVLENLNDLIRLGVYTQTEGTCHLRKTDGVITDYQFRYSTNQIEGMEDLVKKVLKKDFSYKNGRISFSSKSLYEKLLSLGFNNFRAVDWNVPSIKGWGAEGQKEYLRAIIDTLGNIDIDRTTPYIAVTSVNEKSIKHIQTLFGGVFRVERRKNNFVTYRLTWTGKDAMYVLNHLEWKFYNPRNIRGAALIKVIRWEESLWV